MRKANRVGVIAIKEIYNTTDFDFTIWIPDGPNNGTYEKLTGGGCDGDNDWNHSMVLWPRSSYVTDYCYIPWASDRNRYRVIRKGKHPKNWRCGGDAENKLTSLAGLWLCAAGEDNTLQFWDGTGHMITESRLGGGNIDLVMTLDAASNEHGFEMTLQTKNQTTSIDEVLKEAWSFSKELIVAAAGAAAAPA